MNVWSLNRVAAPAGILALAFGIFLAGTPETSGSNHRPVTVAECTTEWDSSDASRYCSSPTITVSNNQCVLDGSCSITATVTAADSTETETTWAPSMDLSVIHNKVSDVDICFAKNSAETAFTAAVKRQCASGETGSKSAVDDGLSLAAEPR